MHRPIVMTSVAFIAGVIPLALSSGAGAEVRQAMGITVLAGMIGVTLFGLLLTPVFYVGLRRLAERGIADLFRRRNARSGADHEQVDGWNDEWGQSRV
jgi:hypothetical protein